MSEILNILLVFAILFLFGMWVLILFAISRDPLYKTYKVKQGLWVNDGKYGNYTLYDGDSKHIGGINQKVFNSLFHLTNRRLRYKKDDRFIIIHKDSVSTTYQHTKTGKTIYLPAFLSDHVFE